MNERRIQWMKTQLEALLAPTALTIQDDSAKHIGHAGAKDGAGHFIVTIASPLFAQKPLIKCHRLVYAALESAIPTEIHALNIKIVRT